MVSGQDSMDFISAYFLYGLIELLWVGGGIKGVQAALVHQIPGIQILSLRLVKAAMSGGVSRRMHDLDFPPAQIQAVTAMQNSLRHPLKDPIRIQGKLRREITGEPCQIFLDNGQR